jgi:thiol-disulfide isomerase/thioredoxin
MKLVSRRSYLMGAVGTLAAGAGLGLAWYQLRGGTSVPEEAEQAFWALSLQGPAGQAQAMSSFKGQPLLLNFWATWCPPCIEELPLLSKFFQENKAKGWQVLGIAVDQPSSVRRFLDQTPVSFPVVMGGTAGISLSQSLGNRQGGLPFSVLFNAQGKVVRHTIGKLSPSDLVAWRQAV